jgi:hypothetical protein
MFRIAIPMIALWESILARRSSQIRSPPRDVYQHLADGGKAVAHGVHVSFTF